MRKLLYLMENCLGIAKNAFETVFYFMKMLICTKKHIVDWI